MILTFSTIEDAEAREAAAAVVGLPNKHLGRGDGGVDCAGCAKLYYDRFNIRCDLPESYQPTWWRVSPRRMVDHIEGVGWPKVVSGLVVPLDALVFANADRHGDHIGVFIGAGQFVHCWAERASIEPLDGPAGGVRWLDRLVAVYRPRRTNV